MKKTIFFIAFLLAIVPFVHATKVWTKVTRQSDIHNGDKLILVMEDYTNNRYVLKANAKREEYSTTGWITLESLGSKTLSSLSANYYQFEVITSPIYDTLLCLATTIEKVQDRYNSSTWYTWCKLQIFPHTGSHSNHALGGVLTAEKATYKDDNTDASTLVFEETGDGHFFVRSSLETDRSITSFIHGYFDDAAAYRNTTINFIGYTAPHFYTSYNKQGGAVTTPINQWATNQTLAAASTGSGGNMAAAWSIYKEVEITEITLDEEEDNSSTLSANAGKVVNATVNRTLFNSSYNTFTLPFDVTADEVTSQFGTGTEIYALSEVSSDATTGAKILTFGTSCTAMTAGKPYLIKPANNTTLLSFTNKTIVNTATEDVIDDVHFVPVFSPTAVTADANHLFLGQNDLLYHPVTTGNIPGLRGYFYMGTPAQSCMARIGSPRGVVTKLHEVQHEISAEKLIRAHQLIIRVNGHTYNAQGAIIH